VEEEKIVDEGIFRRERFHKQQVCVAGKNFFVNFRKVLSPSETVWAKL